MPRASTKASTKPWTDVEVPARLARPDLADFVTDGELRRHGWPKPHDRQHPLALIGRRRFRQEVHTWRTACAREHQAITDMAWPDAVALGALVPMPRDEGAA